MNYVVVDLEWNQAMSSKSSVFNKLPIHLGGEIIEIGAVKLTEDMMPGEEFTIDVKPVYFRRMHYKVKKITGFDKERLSHGHSFPDAMEQFRAWCGDDVTFITWGCDDQRIMEQNIIIHDLDWDWIAGWINLQLIYNLQTGGDKNQKSLASAMEHFEIEQTRVAHDALGDAYNTAVVASRLDMAEGLRMYDEAAHILATRMPNYKPPEENDGPDTISHDCFERAREGEWDVRLTPTKAVPHDWFGVLSGKRVLGLASGGAQQMPIFAALGAVCTVLDYSTRQLESERAFAAREGYPIEIVRADMSRPLPFRDGSFDLIFHPVSNCYVEDVRSIWRECARVLVPGGRLLAGLDNGMIFLVDEAEERIVNSLPFNPLRDPAQMEQLRRADGGVQFSHTLDEQLGGQLEAGFRLLSLYEDSNGAGRLHELGIPCFFATLCEKSI